MGIRENMAKRRAAPKMVDCPVKGLGTLKVKRLSLPERLAFPEGSKYGPAMVAAAAHDEEGIPLYASPAEVEAEDLGLFDAIFTECQRINALDEEVVNAAAKK